MITAAGRKGLGPEPRVPGVSSYNSPPPVLMSLFPSSFPPTPGEGRVRAALPARPAALSYAVSAGRGGERGAGALPAEEAAGPRGGALRQPPAARGSGGRRGGRAAAAGAGLVPELPGPAGRAEEAGGTAGRRWLPAQRPTGKCTRTACTPPSTAGRSREAGVWGGARGCRSLAPSPDRIRCASLRVWEESVTANRQFLTKGGSSEVHGFPVRALSRSETARLEALLRAVTGCQEQLQQTTASWATGAGERGRARAGLCGTRGHCSPGAAPRILVPEQLPASLRRGFYRHPLTLSLGDKSFGDTGSVLRLGFAAPSYFL